VTRFLKKTLLVLLLGWLPLQTSALPLLAMLCEQDPAGMHGGAVHAHPAQHGDYSGHNHHGDGDGDSSSPLLHYCCHNLSSAALPALTAPAHVAPAGIEPTPLFHASSFFPEQPLPPPLAA